MPISAVRARLVRWPETFPVSCWRSSAATRPEWDLLRAHSAELAGAAGERDWLSTSVEDRTAAWLAAEDRRDALTEFVAARRYAGGGFATSTKEGVVLAQLDGAPDDVPASVLRLDEAESSLRAQVRRMRREDDDLVLEIFAGLRKVDQGGDFPEVAARLLGSGEPVDLPVEVHPDAAVTRWMGEPHQYHDYGVLTVRIPLHALSTGSWQLELDMQHSGVRRTGRVDRAGGPRLGRANPVGRRPCAAVGLGPGGCAARRHR